MPVTNQACFLVQPDEVADEKIVGAVVALLGAAAGGPAGEAQNDFVRQQQAIELRHRRLTVARRARDLTLLLGVRTHGDADAQLHDAFRDLVDQLALLRLVLVEQQMQLAERRAGDLP